jgi:peptide/nickel transport system permease protein
VARIGESQPHRFRSSSLWLDTWRRLRRNRAALAGLAILCSLSVVAIAAPAIAPYDPNVMELRQPLQPPNSPGHLLGSDELGRDILSRLIHGSRASLAVGLIVVSMAGSLGVGLGALSGYFGGLVDLIIMRVVDVLMAFPFLVLALAAVAIVGPGLNNLMFVLGAISWTGYARLMRGLVLSVRQEEYVTAARLTGARHGRIIWRHILPNCLGIVIVQATFGVATAILAAAGLSFLGLGAQPPTAEWGAMLNAAKPYLRQRPLMSILPGAAIMLTVLAINFVGDGLRDALDPRLRT